MPGQLPPLEALDIQEFLRAWRDLPNPNRVLSIEERASFYRRDLGIPSDLPPSEPLPLTTEGQWRIYTSQRLLDLQFTLSEMRKELAALRQEVSEAATGRSAGGIILGSSWRARP